MSHASSRAGSSSSPDKELLQERLRYHGLDLEPDNGRGSICWNQYSKDYPRNWSPWAKYYTAVVICWLELYMTAISSAGTGAANSARKEYGISKRMGYFAFVTIYLLGQTVGGIFCSPISETFGRKTIYILSASMFCVFSAIVGAVPSLAGVFVGRFFQGVAAAIPATVAFGNFDDLFGAQTRIWVVYGYTFAGMVGLALGPIYSAYVLEKIGWRWIFYISTIISGVSTVLCLFIKESKATQLLEAKVDDLRRETDNDTFYPSHQKEKEPFTIQKFLKTSLFRPLAFLVTEPLILFCSLLCSIAFGLVYGLTESLTIVYTSPPFPFTETSSSLSFIAILIGEGLNILPRLYDHHLFGRFRQQNRRILPETKIRSFALACPALAIGLWIFAWTIPPKVTTVPWPVSMIGLVCIGFALNDFSYVLFGYATDSYGEYAASAVSAISLSRTLTAAVFPLFIEDMYMGLGSNVATTIFAAVATAFAFTPILFLGFGGRLRRASGKARGDEDCLVEENGHLDEGKDGGN